MMSGDGEPAKFLLPYLRRAGEIQKYEPLVAYYCRRYAMVRGLKIPSKERTETINQLLDSLMKQLQKDKKSVHLSSKDNLYVEGFATRLLRKADKQERRGKADLNTAKTFYAASLFFEILHIFNDVPFDIEQKQKYAAWRAAEIRKALKERSQPSVGLPASDEASSISDGGFSSLELPSEEIAADSPELQFPSEQSSAPGSKNDAVQVQFPISSLQACDDGSDRGLTGGPTMSTTTNSNQEDASDDDEFFHDCSQEVEHNWLSMSSDFCDGLDSKVSASAVQQQFSFSTTQFCDNRSDPTLIFDIASGPTVSTTSDSNQQDVIDDEDESFHDCSEEADHRGLILLSDFGSESDGTISPPITVQEQFPLSTIEVCDKGSDPTLVCDTGAGSPTLSTTSNSNQQNAVDDDRFLHDFSQEADHNGLLSCDFGSGLADHTIGAPADVQGQRYHPSAAEVVKAHKASRFAVNALGVKDVPSAVSYLKQALDLLTNNPQ